MKSFKRNLNRKSYRGHVKGTKGQLAKAAKSATGYAGHGHHSGYVSKKLAPISDEVTNYGATKFRSPFREGEFVGFKGEPVEAGVLDIDGTLQTFGQGADKELLKWVEELQKKHPDMVWLVVTARDHGSFGYDSSFNWVMRHFPYPFAAMVARAKTDPRYASEFKREVAQGWEDMGLYKIIAAADDNEWVIKMWKQWAIEHFDEPEDFSLFEASYGSYASWRSELPSKGRSVSSYGGYGTSSYTDDVHKDQVWIRSVQGSDGKWSQAHWAKKDSQEAKDQRAKEMATYGPPGTPAAYGKDPVDGLWKSSALHGQQPQPGDDIAHDHAWAVYFARREDAGAYLAPDFTVDVEDYADYAELDYFIERPAMELWVSHEHPTMTPDDIANMSNKELWEAVDLDYEEELYEAIDRKWPDVFAMDDLRFMEVSELEELVKMEDEKEAIEYFTSIMKYVTISGVEPLDLDEVAEERQVNERKILEQEVYANSDLAESEIEALDTEVLRQILAHNDMLNSLDEEGIEMPPTGELNVTEVLAAVAERDPADEVLDEAEQIISRYDSDEAGVA